MELRTLKDLDVAGKQVIVRVDFNVPCRDGKVCDATRITAALPTIEYLKSQRCRIVLLTHLGKPNNEHDVHLSLRQVFDYLAERIPSVQFAPQIPGTAEAITRSKTIREGDVVSSRTYVSTPVRRRTTQRSPRAWLPWVTSW